MKIKFLAPMFLALLFASCQQFDDAGMGQSAADQHTVSVDQDDALQGRISKNPCFNRHAVSWNELADELNRVSRCGKNLPTECDEEENQVSFTESFSQEELPTLLSYCSTFSPGSCPNCAEPENSYSVAVQDQIIQEALAVVQDLLETCSDEFLFLNFEVTPLANCPPGSPSCWDICTELRFSAFSTCCLYTVGF